MEKIKAIFCVLFGHSRIQSQFFGYWYCGRCGQQIGDSLAGVYSAKNVVIIGHDAQIGGCQTCRDNYKKCRWKDKFLTPNPFKKNDK